MTDVSDDVTAKRCASGGRFVRVIRGDDDITRMLIPWWGVVLDVLIDGHSTSSASTAGRSPDGYQ